MRILVTGAQGFIGGHLMSLLNSLNEHELLLGTCRGPSPYSLFDLKTGCKNKVVQCDLTIEAQVAHLIYSVRPDLVFHLAGNPNTSAWGVDVSMSNAVSTHSLLRHLSHLGKPVRFVLASSAAVYGDESGRGFWATETTPTNPNSAYGASKLAAEAMVRAFTRKNGIRGLSVRMAATVGAGATHGLLPDLVRKLRAPGTELALLGAWPGASKPFTHVSDVVDGLIHMAGTDLTGAVNMCSNDPLTVLEVAELVSEQLGGKKAIAWSGQSWEGDNRCVRVDSSLAFRWGWTPGGDSREAVTKAAVELDQQLTKEEAE